MFLTRYSTSFAIATNRKLMAKEHAIERTIEILQQSDDIDLLPRVVRLYGTFAIDCSGTLDILSIQIHVCC